MGKRIFTASVILAKTPGAEPEVFNVGDEVPEWALNMVGDHVTQGNTRAATAPTVDEQHAADTDEVEDEADDDSDADDEAEGEYAELNKDELKKLAKARGIAGFSVMAKQELIDAIEADDEDEE